MTTDATNPGAGDGNTSITGTEVENATQQNTPGLDDVTNLDDLEVGGEGDDGTSDDGITDETTTQADDETEEVDFEGAKFRVPKPLKDALLRHADYTKKTQELADQRRNFEKVQSTTLADNKDYVDNLVKVRSLDAQLEQYKDVNWSALEQQDPAAAAQHWRHFSQLKDAHTEAQAAANGAKDRISLEAQRKSATRAEEVRAALPKIIPGFNADMDAALANYGAKNGISTEEMQDFVMRNPNAALILHKASQWDAHQAKTATAARVEKQQAAKPAAEIGNRSSAVKRDPATMSQAEYVKWRNSQK